MALLNSASAVRLGSTQVQAVYLGATKVWPATAPPVIGHIASAGVFTTGGTVTTVQITRPASAQDGDLCILVAAKDSAPAMVVTSMGMVDLCPPIAAGTSYWCALYGTQAGGVLTFTLDTLVNVSAVAHWFRGVDVGTVGTTGVRSGTNTSLSVPGVSGSGTTYALIGDRSQAATAGEQIHTISTTWGLSIAYYEGNPGIGAGGGISSHWLVKGSQGETSGQSVTFGDASPSAWGVCFTMVEV